MEASATAATLTNTAKVYEGAEVKGTATHTIYGGEDLSKYSLQKKIIAVNGIPADDTTEIVNGDKLTGDFYQPRNHDHGKPVLI